MLGLKSLDFFFSKTEIWIAVVSIFNEKNGTKEIKKCSQQVQAYMEAPSKTLRKAFQVDPHEVGWENAKSVQSCNVGKC